ncbi:tetratricopeptide repeat protein [Portibacter marinus]|uniref:tetratricopeptide repeat protein n=1 Tax=Portibacter marinus TaxID=2898660 RepID=UPI001F1CF05C|nr:tetratricopeptide repeat protein [Portibacter marinus]
MEKKKGPKGKSTLRRAILIIIGILLLAASIIGYNLEKTKKSPEGIFAAHYEVYPNVYHPVTVGNSDLMTRAFAAYENKNFKEAAELLEERIATSSAIPLKFYQAIAYGEMGNLPLAIKNLENIRRFDSPYIAESYWYLGLYYTKLGNKDAAVKRLQEFYEHSDNPERKKEAADIIHTLQGD